MKDAQKEAKKHKLSENVEEDVELSKTPKKDQPKTSQEESRSCSGQPCVVVVFSGKRKSGKDYVTDLLQQRFGRDVCTILRLSAPLKSQFAKDHNLSLEKLLDATEYKERYRADMIHWGEEKRNQDPGYFCHLATAEVPPSFLVWIISDARRQSDVKYFKEHYKQETVTVRVEADLQVRQSRGLVFIKGVDDAESECDLDTGVKWDFTVHNNGDETTLDTVLEYLTGYVKEKMSVAK